MPMKVAISALGPGATDKVDDRFGRAQYIVVCEDDGTVLEAIENTDNRNALQGAGIGTAELVAGAGVGAVLTGHLGPKAMGALSSAGIEGYVASGLTVGEAVAKFGADELDRIETAAPAHGG